MQMNDLPADLQIGILNSVISRLAMRLLRAGIDPETVPTQELPGEEEGANDGSGSPAC